MSYQPGDILLVNDDTGQADFLGNLIQAGEQSRYGRNAPASMVWWTHSAIITDTDGGLVEALSRGVARSHISKYAHRPTKILNVPATKWQRALIVQGALTNVGLEYNRIDFVALAIQLLFGIDWAVNDGRADICSELVARYTEKCIPGYQYKPGNMMPSDLDVYFGQPHGDPLPSLQRWGLLFRTLVKAINPF